jgi:hypothetical protein
LACLKGTGQQSGGPVWLWIPGLTGLGGTIEQNGDRVCVNGDRVCVLVPSLTGLRGTALQSEYCAVLCRLWGCGWQSRDRAEIVQGLGVQPSETELLQGCAIIGGMAGKAEIVQGWGAQTTKTELLLGFAGLEGAWPGRDHKCLWIPGLKGSSHGGPAGLRGGSLW